MAKDQNRFIKIGYGASSGSVFNSVSTVVAGSAINNLYRQYHYDLSDNALVGQATPTTIETITRDDLRSWSDISEIRYANDVSYDKLENPKVILYRNKDNSCYIILRIGDNKHGVFYGVNERNVEIGRQSFAVYEVSEDVGSFTDGVKRLIYVDESGLYFVPIEGNSIKDVIKTYQNEGKFNFKGSVIKVSAIDGTITLDDEPITKDNFFDNWVWENNKTVLSTKQPESSEILRNFYPPKGDYIGICGVKYESNGYTSGWLNSFINKRFQLTKAKSKNGAEELVRDGTFSSLFLLSHNGGVYKSTVRLIREKGGKVTPSIDTLIFSNSLLFKNPDFVKSLKPAFKELEKDHEHNKESTLWILFEIVRNL